MTTPVRGCSRFRHLVWVKFLEIADLSVKCELKAESRRDHASQVSHCHAMAMQLTITVHERAAATFLNAMMWLVSVCLNLGCCDVSPLIVHLPMSVPQSLGGCWGTIIC